MNAEKKLSGDKLNSVSIVFPAYNESENIKLAVEKAGTAFSKFFNDLEIIVVNDGSSDDTGSIVKKLSKKSNDVVGVNHEVNKGYGAALLSGFDKASKEYIFFSDSDLQFDLEEIDRLVEWIGEYDIVTGYRENRADSFQRLLNAWAWGLLVKLLFNIKARDIDCAFKLFKKDMITKLGLESDGAMVNTEMLALAEMNGYSLKEVPVSHYPRVNGTQTGANIKVVLKAFVELFKMHSKLKHRK